MCGFTGFVDVSLKMKRDKLVSTAKSMVDTLRHRGPDDDGVWADEEAGLALGHRRLSIIDLTSGGAQPMVSASGRYVLAYNGEVYNFPYIRDTLDKKERINWRGQCDTEVILEAMERFGVEKALNLFNGMFAFALWDRKERTMVLARDRMGKKPLYYGWSGGVFFCGSELKAFRKHPQFHGEINRDAIALLLRYGYILSPHSIFNGIYKLSPGSYLHLKWDSFGGEDSFSPHPEPETQVRLKPKRYWRARDVLLDGADNPLRVTDNEAADLLEATLKDAVKIRMVADVPLGALLSGGIDSSLVVALMQSQSDKPVKTFTIGFDDPDFNEAPFAKDVAQHLATDHTQLYVPSKLAMDVIPSLPQLFDEPHADSSQIPTYLVSQLARENVTVSLTGDGGDELFAGYHRYMWGQWFHKKADGIPKSVRGLAAFIMRSVPARGWSRLFEALKPVLPVDLRQPNAGDKIHKLADILKTVEPEVIYRQLVSQWEDPASIMTDGAEPRTVITDIDPELAKLDFIHRLMSIDMEGYLTDDILSKVDRASMGVSLEVRCPILDFNVVELSGRIVSDMKLRNGQSKWLLRQVLFRYLPKKLIERPKKGFSVPLAQWLKGGLRDWAEDLLDEKRLKDEGFLESGPIRKIWSEHLSGTLNWRSRLWNVLMFQAWLDEYGR